MKKLILALAAVGAAVSVQAASVTWGSGKLYTAAGTDGGFSSTAIKNAATGYLFALSSSEYDAFLADYTANGNMKSVYETYKDSFGSATGSGTSKSLTSTLSITTEANVGDTVYGALLPPAVGVGGGRARRAGRAQHSPRTGLCTRRRPWRGGAPRHFAVSSVCRGGARDSRTKDNGQPTKACSSWSGKVERGMLTSMLHLQLPPPTLKPAGACPQAPKE